MEIYLGNQKINQSYIGNQSIARVPNLALQVDIDYVVAAGGGGGGRGGAGGGAGGLITGSFSIKQAEYKTIYTVTVGQGGISGSVNIGGGGNGGNSFFGTASIIEVTAIGGGGGAGFGGTLNQSGSNGGSGGGATGRTSGSIGLGTIGQGNNGGRNICTGSSNARFDFQKGGGGGSSISGSNGFNFYDNLLDLWFGFGGNGGSGSIVNWNPLNSGRLCDGGGAGEDFSFTANYARTSPGLAGGLTGANGGSYPNVTPSTPANGGGGGGGGYAGGASTIRDGSSGGSGLVLVKYLGTQIAEGGQISTSGSYTIHTFTSSGNFII